MGDVDYNNNNEISDNVDDDEEEYDDTSSSGGDDTRGFRGLLDNSDQRKNRLYFKDINNKRESRLQSVWIRNVIDTTPLIAQGRLDPNQLPPPPPPPMKPSEDMITVRVRKRSGSSPSL